MKNILIVYNPVAGKGVSLKWIAKLCRALEEENYNVLPHPTSEVDTPYDICDEFYQSKDLFIIIGGDGTINSAIQRLANQDKPMMIIPRGTANVLGNILNLRIKKIEDVIKFVKNSHIEKLPVGKVKYNSREKFFILMTGIGFDAEVVNKTKKRKGIFNKFFFFKNSLKVLREYNFPEFKIILENGKKINSRFCIVSNVKYYAGKFKLCKDFDIKTQKFCLFSFKWDKKIRGLTYFLHLLKGDLNRLKDVDFFIDNECKITPIKNKDILFQIDGEKGGILPVEISLKNDYINILIPN